MVLWAGASGAAFFAAVFLIEGRVRPGYSAVRHPVSALALGPRGAIQAGNFLLCGAAITSGALGLMLGEGSLLLGIALILFGLGLVASGAFRMDPMRGYPPGEPEGDPAEFTTRHQLHDIAGAVVFCSLPAAAAMAALVMPGALWTTLSVAVALGLVIAAGAFASAWEHDAATTGLIQRMFLVPGCLWLAALFVHHALA